MIDLNDLDQRILEMLTAYSPYYPTEISDHICNELGRPIFYRDFYVLVQARLDQMVATGEVRTENVPGRGVWYWNESHWLRLQAIKRQQS